MMNQSRSPGLLEMMVGGANSTLAHRRAEIERGREYITARLVVMWFDVDVVAAFRSAQA
jgi:hypothetical protein